jgi:hypothetical protein
MARRGMMVAVIDFEAYSGDCLVRGQLELGSAGRLTDLLNAVAGVPVRTVRLEDLDDGHLVDVPDLTVPYEDLCAVVAKGPPGDPARRVRTVPTRGVAEIGPYVIEGDAHGTPASSPLGPAMRGWTPLTNVVVNYQRNGQPVTDVVSTLIVNRKLAGWLRSAT